MRRFVLVTLLMACFGLAQAAGQSASTTFAVTATVSGDCTIKNTGSLNFGAYSTVASTPVQAGTQLKIACTKGTVAKVGISYGQHAAGSTRRMASSAGEYLTYQIYQPDPNKPNTCAYQHVWGNSGSGLLSLGAIHDNQEKIYNVCGQLPPGQNIAQGSYSDTEVATITY